MRRRRKILQNKTKTEATEMQISNPKSEVPTEETVVQKATEMEISNANSEVSSEVPTEETVVQKATEMEISNANSEVSNVNSQLSVPTSQASTEKKKPLGRPTHNPDYVLTPYQVGFITAIILTTLNSISSTPLLELFKKDFMKLYAVGSILLQQNTEKQVYSGAGVYVSRSLKAVLNKLYSSTHSAEVQELVVEWVHMLIVNQKFIKKGDVFINSLKALFDGKTAVPTESEKPVEPKASKRRTARKAVEDKNVDAS